MLTEHAVKMNNRSEGTLYYIRMHVSLVESSK